MIGLLCFMPPTLSNFSLLPCSSFKAPIFFLYFILFLSNHWYAFQATEAEKKTKSVQAHLFFFLCPVLLLCFLIVNPRQSFQCLWCRKKQFHHSNKLRFELKKRETSIPFYTIFLLCCFFRVPSGTQWPSLSPLLPNSCMFSAAFTAACWQEMFCWACPQDLFLIQVRLFLTCSKLTGRIAVWKKKLVEACITWNFEKDVLWESKRMKKKMKMK